jgi:two-component system chemotaxis sensor kinase CheA
MSDELSEIWALYAEDGDRSLNEAEDTLLGLKSGSAEASAIAGLFRSIHTFKGNARVMGLSIIESRAHQAEDLIGLVRDEGAPLDDEMIDLLLEAVDLFRGMLEHSAATRKDAAPEASDDLSERLRRKFLAWRGETKEPSRSDHGKEGGDVSDSAFLIENEKDIKETPPDGQELFADDSILSEEPIEVPLEPETTEVSRLHDEEPEALLFDPMERGGLAEDPVYREIFSGMVRDELHQLRQAMETMTDDPGVAMMLTTAAAERLRHAAEQLDLRPWVSVLTTFLDIQSPQVEQIDELFAGVSAMAEKEFGTTIPPVSGETTPSPKAITDDSMRSFFKALEKPWRTLASLGTRLTENKKDLSGEIVLVIGEIKSLAESHGFLRLVDLTEDFLETLKRDPASLPQRFHRLEFRLQEEMVAIERTMSGGRPDALLNLRRWCVERVFACLLNVNDALDRMEKQQDIAGQCERFNEMMRQVYYACQHYRLENAAQLSMALVDLFSRVEVGELAPDVLLLRIAKSFVADMDLVLNAMRSGQAPDMKVIEKLLRETSDVAFSLNDTVSSSYIEARIGLPQSFHKVLTPESIKAVCKALKVGCRFFIVRADLNANEDLAALFLNWLSPGTAEVISNVTVFREDSTLFDFLLATRLTHEQLSEAMLVLDPQGKFLHIEMALTDHQSSEPENGRGEDSIPFAQKPEQESFSGNMLESIGELVTAQSVVQHLLATLTEDDWVHLVESEVNSAGGCWSNARDPVRRRLELWRDNIEKLVQVEAQINTLLERLHESALVVRTRPAGLLLKPLAPLADSLARSHGRNVTLITVGDEIMLDCSLLEQLKAPLRALVSFCILQSIETPEERQEKGKSGIGQVRVILVKEEDRVHILVEDDGLGIDMERVTQRIRHLDWNEEQHSVATVLREGYGVTKNSDFDETGAVDLAAIRTSLRTQGGDLRVANLPTGGLHFSLSLPLAMVVVDGMVIRVGAVQYVIPIDAIQRIVHSRDDAFMRISADHGRPMLKLVNGDVLPVQFLKCTGPNDRKPSIEGDLTQAFGKREELTDGLKQLFVVVGKQSQRVAIAVDELIGQQQVLIRPLQGYLAGIRSVVGCAMLGSGEVGMVLNMTDILGREQNGSFMQPFQGGL